MPLICFSPFSEIMSSGSCPRLKHSTENFSSHCAADDSFFDQIDQLCQLSWLDRVITRFQICFLQTAKQVSQNPVGRSFRIGSRFNNSFIKMTKRFF
jgi:hypothetical protein